MITVTREASEHVSLYVARYNGRIVPGNSFADAITKMIGLLELEKMTNESFNLFLCKLPQRVQILVRGGMCDWRTVLPEWYIKTV